jgi:hypothetical protein
MHHKHQFLSYALHRMRHPHLVFKLTRHRSCIVYIVNALIHMLSKNITSNLSIQLYLYQHHGQQKNTKTIVHISFPSLTQKITILSKWALLGDLLAIIMVLTTRTTIARRGKPYISGFHSPTSMLQTLILFKYSITN